MVLVENAFIPSKTDSTSMTIVFNDPYLKALFENNDNLGKPKYSNDVVKKYIKTVLLISLAESIIDLYRFKGLHFEKLSNGLHSVRVDQKYRLEFSVEKDKIEIKDIILIEALSNHYGD
jgi:toxin HigB-1